MVLDFVGLGDDAAQPRLWLLVIGPVREKDRAIRPDQEVRVLVLVGFEAPQEGFGVVANRGTRRVTAEEVLGPHDRAVGSRPEKGCLVDCRGDPAPDNGVFEASCLQNLRHLAHVAEHVGEITDFRGATE